MADYWALSSSNWSNLSNWLTGVSLTAGALPGPFDDVYANGRTIWIDVSPTVNLISTAATVNAVAGGVFRPNNNITVRANVLCGTTTVFDFVSAAPNVCTLYGNITGITTSNADGNLYAIRNSSTGTMFITSDSIRCINGQILTNEVAGTCYMRFNTLIGTDNTATFNTGSIRNTTGTLFITGNMISGSGQYNDTGGGMLTNMGTGVTHFSGSAIGGTAGLARAIRSGGGQMYLQGYFRGGAGNSANRAAAIEVRTSSYIGVSGIIEGNGSPGLVIQGGTPTIDVTGVVRGGGSTVAGILGDAGSLGAGGASPTINVRGSVFGSDITGATGPGINQGYTGGVVNLSGTVNGSRVTTAVGVNNSGLGVVNISGAAIGIVGVGVSNSSSGVVYIKRVVGGPGGPLNIAGGTAAGVSNTQNGQVYVEEVEFGAQGASPISGPVFMIPRTTNVTIMNQGLPTFTPVTLFRSTNYPGLVPPPSSVRLGTVYGNGDFTGTMVVPNPASVQLGVGVDNTVGTAALTPATVWNYSRTAGISAGSMGERLRNAVTTDIVGSIIASFNLSGN
jgi:hypothetical protein